MIAPEPVFQGAVGSPIRGGKTGRLIRTVRPPRARGHGPVEGRGPETSRP